MTGSLSDLSRHGIMKEREGIKSHTTLYHTQKEGIKSGTVHLRVSNLVCSSDETELYKYGCHTLQFSHNHQLTLYKRITDCFI
jgi:hypothetical protein